MKGLGSRTLGELVDSAAQTHGERPALMIHEERVSYRALAERARAMAGYLRGAGLAPGDRVAVWLPNGGRFVELAFGCAMAGLVLVPLNTRLKSVDAADALRKSGARALFCTQEFLGIDYLALVREIRAARTLPELTLIVNVDDGASADVRALAEWQAGTRPAPDLPAVSPDAPAAINFTSGTTSSPKGAVVSHRSLLYIAREVGLRMDVTADDRMVSAMPFYHNGGFVPTLLTCLMAGCTLHTQPRFDPEYVLDVVGRHRCTLMGGVGTMYTMMLDVPARARRDFASLRAVRITGPADMRRAVYERFGHPMIYSLYGMTESTAAVTLTCPSDSIEEQLETNGKPLPGVKIRIAGPDGLEVPAGAQGEIWIGGPCLLQGYFRDPDATAQVLTSDGWLRSGDLGYVDERGNVVLVGRIKDMYRSGGENVACPEVEEFLRSHPAVLHAAVLGVPDARLGEVGLAFVVRQAGRSVTAEELQAFCRRHLANFKVPRHIAFRDELPMTVSGRVEKYKLRAQALAVAGPRAPA